MNRSVGAVSSILEARLVIPTDIDTRPWMWYNVIVGGAQRPANNNTN